MFIGAVIGNFLAVVIARAMLKPVYANLEKDKTFIPEPVDNAVLEELESEALETGQLDAT